MKILPFGDRALLAEVDSLDEAVRLAAALESDRNRRPGVLELVPAARTVLVRIDPHVLSLTAAAHWITHVEVDAGRPEAGDLVTVRVRYDGPDLASTAELLGISADELISRHSSAPWRAAFVGFAPGFAYLTSTTFRLDIPRRATSRPRVPARSVGLAGEFSGIYPRESPGGWQLIGSTDAVLWDPDRDPPALLRPGTEVRMEVLEG
jgi:KipI family sensor histidine kinase inhibitor